MRNRRLRLFSGKRGIADVAGPQAGTDSSLDCYLRNFSGMVRAGRTQAACLVKRGLSGALPETLQEDWSRGCPRAQLSYLVFACWRLLPPAQRKKKPLPMWQSRFRPNPPTRANTSDLKRRAARGNHRQHAVFYSTRAKQDVPAADLNLPMLGAIKRSKASWVIRSGGLLAHLNLMLKPDAIAYTQDRNLC